MTIRRRPSACRARWAATQPGAGEHVVVEEPDQLALRVREPGVAGGGEARVGLAEGVQRDGVVERLDRLRGAVGRAVDDDQHVGAGLAGELVAQALQQSQQRLAALVGRDHQRERAKPAHPAFCARMPIRTS